MRVQELTDGDLLYMWKQNVCQSHYNPGEDEKFEFDEWECQEEIKRRMNGGKEKEDEHWDGVE